MTTKADNSSIRTIGRRKTASARILFSLGKGKITVNDRELEKYFPIELWRERVWAPLKLAGREKDFDVSVKVAGGGISAQSEAVRHGIARALIKWDEALRPIMRAEGYLSRDPRAKERKKFGLYKARRGHQWRKR